MFSSPASEDQEGQSSVSAADGESSGGGEELEKYVLVKEVKVPWDPLSSPDWDKEQHSKDSLLRIKR